MNGKITKTLVVGTGLFMLLGSPMLAAAEDLGQATTFHHQRSNGAVSRS